MSSSGRIRRYPSVGTSSIGHHEPRGEEPPWEMAIYGDLTDKQPELIGQLLDVPPNSRGTIFFDSCGGSAYTGLGLASLIQLRGLHTVGVVASECSSAALLPFAACKERYVTAHSTLLFHPIRWSSDDDIRMEEAAEWARHFQLLEKDLDVLLSRMFAIDEKQLTEWTHPGRFVSGRELVQAGLAKEIDLFSGTVWEQIEKMGD
jgi:ATP-dependent protease ClpP protease subunit